MSTPEMFPIGQHLPYYTSARSRRNPIFVHKGQRCPGRSARDLIGLSSRAVMAALTIHIALSGFAHTGLVACLEGGGCSRTRSARGTGRVTLTVGSSLILASVGLGLLNFS